MSVRLEDIIITPELDHRTSRAPSLTKENEALHLMALNEPAERIVATLLEVARDLCEAGSTGLSMLEPDGAGGVLFRWTAILGKWAPYQGGSLPRHASPCGLTLDAGKPMLFRHPERYFNFEGAPQPPIFEGLVVPIRVGKNIPGTLWIVSHTPRVQFDREDVRVLESLAEFAAYATVRLASERAKR